jgi:ankyrin repeat protein
MSLNNFKDCLQAIQLGDENVLSKLNAYRIQQGIRGVGYTEEHYIKISVEALKKYKPQKRKLNVVIESIDFGYMPKGVDLVTLLNLAGIQKLTQVSRFTNLSIDLQAKIFNFLPDSDFPGLFKLSRETKQIASELYWRQKLYKAFPEAAQRLVVNSNFDWRENFFTIYFNQEIDFNEQIQNLLLQGRNAVTILNKLQVMSQISENANSKNKRGWTKVCYAACENQTQRIKQLFSLGANLNILSDDGCSPVSIAAFHGQVDAIRVLHKLGADISIPDNKGTSPVFIAAQEGRVETIQVLAELGANLNTPRRPKKRNTTPVFIAAMNGRANTVRVLSELGANLNTPLNTGATPAFIAAARGHVEVIRVLHELGANLRTPNIYGATPAFIAAENGHAGVVRVFRELDTDRNTPRNNNGDTQSQSMFFAPVRLHDNEEKKEGNASKCFS